MFDFLSPKKKAIVAVLVLVFFTGVFIFNIFLTSEPVEAAGAGKVVAGAAARIAPWIIGGTAAYLGIGAISDEVAKFLQTLDVTLITLLEGLAKFCAKIFTWIVDLLVQVAAYNDFLSATAVVTGWVIVRDVCNMFFVLILLVIAIATILHVESYSYKKLLPKLLLMAVLINFSKTICGIIIDFSQVVMLTFVNAFKAAAGANFWQAFGLNNMFSFKNMADQASADAANLNWDITGAALLAFLVVLIAAITVGILLVVLVARIIVLWTLIILSPLAYLLSSFPQGQQYAKQWWGEFSKNVITGPVLAFFIWLALIVAGGGTGYTELHYTPSIGFDMSDISDPQNLSSLVVGVTMLLVGLMFAKQAGVVGSGLAGSALSTLQRAGTAPLRAARKAGSLAWKGAKGAGKFGYNRGAERLYASTGRALWGSEVSKKRGDEKRKNVLAQRMARGEVKLGERASRAGERGRLSMYSNARAMGMTMGESLAAAGVATKEGRMAARAKLQKAAQGKAEAGYRDLAAKDPLAAATIRRKYDLSDAKREEKRAKEEVERSAKEETGLRKQEGSLTQRIGRNTARRDEIDSELGGVRRQKAMSDDELAGQIPDIQAQVEARVKDIEAMRAEGGRVAPMSAAEKDLQRRAQRDQIIKEKRGNLDKRDKKLTAEGVKIEQSIQTDTANLTNVKASLDGLSRGEGRAAGLEARASEAKDKKDRLGDRKSKIEERLGELKQLADVRPLTQAEQGEQSSLQGEHANITADIKVQTADFDRANRELKSLLEQHAELAKKIEAGKKINAAQTKAAEAREWLSAPFQKRIEDALREGRELKKQSDEQKLIKTLKEMVKGAGAEDVKNAVAAKTSGGGKKS